MPSAPLPVGEPAPHFYQRTPSNPRYAFDTAAGRYLVLCFLGSAADPQSQAALEAVARRPGFFDDARAAFFAVSIDPSDEAEGRLGNRIPGYRVFWDFDLSVSRLYGSVDEDARADGQVAARRFWLVLDPTMRIMASIPFQSDRSDIAAFLAFVDGLPEPARFAGMELQAPVLILPQVFEPALCRKLIELYEADGGKDSGFMREVDGKTVGVQDHGHKRRRDAEITDQRLIGVLQNRVLRRIVPEIAKIHQFHVTRMERYIVCCYSAEDGGHFAAHRDNTTKGTAHRRFAVSVNLNEEFEGGEVSFPEYGPRSFKPPAGGAVVFSCSLLHKVSKVTAGRRYAFLPFLYDDAAAELRQRNRQYLGEGVAGAPKPAEAAPKPAAPDPQDEPVVGLFGRG